MQEINIQQRLQREIEAAVSLAKEAKLDLTAAVDSLKIELEVVRMFIERHHSEFAKIYPKLEDLSQAQGRGAAGN